MVPTVPPRVALPPRQQGARRPPVGHHPGMDHIPSPKELRTAARACTFLAYAAGLAGIAGGTLVLRDGDLAFAIMLWIITFAVGATLMGVSLVIRAVASLATSVTRMESELAVLVGDRGRDEGLTPPGPDRDPWLRH